MLDEIKTKENFFEMGEQLGKARARHIRSFCKLSDFMASSSKKAGFPPFNSNLLYILPTLPTYRRNKPVRRDWASRYEQVILVYHSETVDFIAKPREKCFWITDCSPTEKTEE